MTSAVSGVPDPEVPGQPRRRQFSAAYKLRILEEADRCSGPGQIGSLLRREGLYSSHLTEWRRARREGTLGALSRKRGPKRRRSEAQQELERLRRENARLRAELDRAKTIIDVQKKVALPASWWPDLLIDLVDATVPSGTCLRRDLSWTTRLCTRSCLA
jgi:transposase-like protein